MAVYEISRGNLEKYLDGQIEKNPKYANLREELIDAFAGTIDPKQIEVNSGEENLWPFSADALRTIKASTICMGVRNVFAERI